MKIKILLSTFLAFTLILSTIIFTINRSVIPFGVIKVSAILTNCLDNNSGKSYYTVDTNIVFPVYGPNRQPTGQYGVGINNYPGGRAIGMLLKMTTGNDIKSVVFNTDGKESCQQAFSEPLFCSSLVRDISNKSRCFDSNTSTEIALSLNDTGSLYLSANNLSNSNLSNSFVANNPTKPQVFLDQPTYTLSEEYFSNIDNTTSDNSTLFLVPNDSNLTEDWFAQDISGDILNSSEDIASEDIASEYYQYVQTPELEPSQELEQSQEQSQEMEQSVPSLLEEDFSAGWDSSWDFIL